MTDRITISLPDDMAADINAQLSYGDNRSEWIREAIQMRLDDQGPDETTPAPEPDRDPQREGAADAVARIVAEVSASWAADDRLEDRREAARRVLAHAVETEEAVGKSSAIVDELFATVEVAGQDRETYWRKNLRPVLKAAGNYSAGRHGYVVDTEYL